MTLHLSRKQMADVGIAKSAGKNNGFIGSTPSRRSKVLKKLARDEKRAWQRAFDQLCAAAGLPCPTHEFYFHPTRKWRIDVCWPDFMTALEIEGGIWSGGRHVHPIGFIKDCEKYNEIAIAGYRLLRCSKQDADSGKVLELVCRARTAFEED